MRGLWGLISALVFALVVAIFAVINVDAVTVDYLFGTAQWPLVLIILASALVGGLAVFGFGIFRILQMRRQVRELTKENSQLKSEAGQRESIDQTRTNKEHASQRYQPKGEKAKEAKDDNQQRSGDSSTKK